MEIRSLWGSKKNPNKNNICSKHDREANDARKKTAMPVAAYTGSAKMELVFVSVGGMDAIAP